MARITLALLIIAAFTLPKEQILAASNARQPVDKLLDNFGDRRELIARLLLPLQAAAMSDQDHENIEKFAENLHKHHADWENQLYDERFSTLDAFATFKEMARGKEAVVRAAIRPLTSRLPDGEKLTEEFMTALSEPIQHGACDLCRAVMTILKLASYIMDWPSLHDVLRLACWVVLPMIYPTWTRVDIICPIVLDLQGQHIYDILRGKFATPIGPGLGLNPLEIKLPPFPQEVCEFVNVCFPPEIGPEREGIRANKKAPLRQPRDKRAAGTIKVAQVADVHVEPLYDEGSLTDCGLPVCCQLLHGTGEAGPWGDYKCNIPQKTVDHMFAWINAQNPDVTIYSGDSCPHSVWQETVDSQLLASHMVLESFNKSMPGKQVFPAIGNHEMYPTNVYSQKHVPATQEINDKLTEWWTPVAKFTQAQIDTMKELSYYTQLALPKLRILSYNTNLLYIYNWYNIHNDQETRVPLPVKPGDRTKMKDFMLQTMVDARNNNEKVILVGHHPPGRNDFILQDSRWLTQLLLEYSDEIVLHVTGHTHKDEYRLVTDPDTGETKSVVYVAPTMNTNGGRNPTLRIYTLDNSTFEVLDYETYYLDMADIGSNPSPVIKYGYSAKEEYGMADLSPASWKDLTDRMNTDGTLFAKFMNNYYTRARPGYICDSNCRDNLMCQLRETNYDRIYACVVALRPPMTPQPTTPPLTCATPPIVQPCVCPTTIPPTLPPSNSGSDRLRMTAAAWLFVCLVGLSHLF